MGLLKKFFTNCAHPKGRMGRVMLKFMNLTHAPLMNWGLVTAIETVYFWPNLPNCVKGVYKVLKPGGRFAIMVEVVDADSKWTSVVEGMTAYTPEQLHNLLDDAGFTQTVIHRKKPMYATIIGVKA